jgi:AcrR family transcriptional regulator
VVEAALKIIDKEGIDALTMRRLGRELHVNGASLYHHFRDKDEILLAVRRKVLAPVTIPTDRSVSWQECCVNVAVRFREALLAHPNTAPLMATTSSRQLSAPLRDFMAGILQEQGIAADHAYAVLDSFSTLAFGSVMFNAGVDEPAVTFGTVSDNHPNLRAAVEQCRFSADERFEATAWALAEGWSVQEKKRQNLGDRRSG